MSHIEEIREFVIKGRIANTVQKTHNALSDGIAAADILALALLPGMEEVGIRFQNGRYFFPQVMAAARSMEKSMDILKPLLGGSNGVYIGKAIIGTVKGDRHDIGKNLVVMMMEGAGFEMVDLGVDVSAEQFAEAVRIHKPHLLMLSALLTTTISEMDKTVRTLCENGLREQVRVMIGGAPVTAAFAEKIGADSYAPDAQAATQIAKQLLT